MTVTTRVHVRTGPSTSSKSLAILSVGDSLPSKGSTNGWTKVTYKGKTAYVYSTYLKGSSSKPKTDVAVTNSAAKGTHYATANLNLRTGASLGDILGAAIEEASASKKKTPAKKKAKSEDEAE